MAASAFSGSKRSSTRAPLRADPLRLARPARAAELPREPLAPLHVDAHAEQAGRRLGQDLREADGALEVVARPRVGAAGALEQHHPLDQVRIDAGLVGRLLDLGRGSARPAAPWRRCRPGSSRRRRGCAGRGRAPLEVVLALGLVRPGVVLEVQRAVARRVVAAEQPGRRPPRRARAAATSEGATAATSPLRLSGDAGRPVADVDHASAGPQELRLLAARQPGSRAGRRAGPGPRAAACS